jgi:uncharacterized membrane protein
MSNRAMRKVTARYNWDRLKVSFWFAPLVMSLGAIVLVWVMNWIDRRIPNELLQNSNLVLSGGADQLRSILVGMATSILATAGVVFTLLTLPLSTVAAQYGSRLLRLFLGDRITQFVLGMFVGTFVYCITAATSIPSAEAGLEAPQVLVTVGLLLMMATFGSLILLVQHISIMLQAPQIAAAAGAELLEVVQSEILDEVNSAARPTGLPAPGRTTVENSMKESEGYPVRVPGSGYIQYIDPDIMLTLAQVKNLVIRLLRKPGDFVWPGEVVALVWPSDGIGGQRPSVKPVQFDPEMDKQLRRAFRLGKQRTPTQDVEYAVNQLVEMALRAMSPAINDPFTAMTCLDFMGNGLALFAQKGAETPRVYDQDGRLRLVFEPVPFEQLLNAAFAMLRHCSCDNASVLLHILEVIEAIGQEAKAPEIQQQLLRQVSLIQSESKAGALTEPDRQLIQRRAEAMQMKWAATSVVAAL